MPSSKPSPNRRRLLGATACLGLSCACGAAFAWPTDDYASPPDQDPPPEEAAQGDIACSWSASYGSAAGPGPQLFSSTGNPMLDQGMTLEHAILSQTFGVRPGLFMLNDGNQGNAFATTAILGNHPYPHGTVVFGMTLMMEEFMKAGPMGGRADHAMMGILAHEWGHILQFMNVKARPPGKAMELHADGLAGWYMGMRAMQLAQWNPVDLRTTMLSFFGKGDYAFNDPSHHGTPQERVQAFQGGLQAVHRGASLPSFFQQSAAWHGLPL